MKEYFKYPDKIIVSYAETNKQRFSKKVEDVEKGDLTIFIKKLRKNPEHLKSRPEMFTILPEKEKTLEVCKQAMSSSILYIMYVPDDIKENTEFQEYVLNLVQSHAYFRIGVEILCSHVPEDLAGAIILLKEVKKND